MFSRAIWSHTSHPNTLQWSLDGRIAIFTSDAFYVFEPISSNTLLYGHSQPLQETKWFTLKWVNPASIECPGIVLSSNKSKALSSSSSSSNSAEIIRWLDTCSISGPEPHLDIIACQWGPILSTSACNIHLLSLCYVLFSDGTCIVLSPYCTHDTVISSKYSPHWSLSLHGLNCFVVLSDSFRRWYDSWHKILKLCGDRIRCCHFIPEPLNIGTGINQHTVVVIVVGSGCMVSFWCCVANKEDMGTKELGSTVCIGYARSCPSATTRCHCAPIRTEAQQCAVTTCAYEHSISAIASAQIPSLNGSSGWPWLFFGTRTGSIGCIANNSIRTAFQSITEACLVSSASHSTKSKGVDLSAGVKWIYFNTSGEPVKNLIAWADEEVGICLASAGTLITAHSFEMASFTQDMIPSCRTSCGMNDIICEINLISDLTDSRANRSCVVTTLNGAKYAVEILYFNEAGRPNITIRSHLVTGNPEETAMISTGAVESSVNRGYVMGASVDPLSVTSSSVIAMPGALGTSRQTQLNNYLQHPHTNLEIASHVISPTVIRNTDGPNLIVVAGPDATWLEAGASACKVLSSLVSRIRNYRGNCVGVCLASISVMFIQTVELLSYLEPAKTFEIHEFDESAPIREEDEKAVPYKKRKGQLLREREDIPKSKKSVATDHQSGHEIVDDLSKHEEESELLMQSKLYRYLNIGKKISIAAQGVITVAREARRLCLRLLSLPPDLADDPAELQWLQIPRDSTARRSWLFFLRTVIQLLTIPVGVFAQQAKAGSYVISSRTGLTPELQLLLSQKPQIEDAISYAVMISVVERTHSEGLRDSSSGKDAFSLSLILQSLSHAVTKNTGDLELLTSTIKTCSELAVPHRPTSTLPHRPIGWTALEAYKEICPLCTAAITFDPISPRVSHCSSCQSNLDRCVVSLRLIENGWPSNAVTESQPCLRALVFQCRNCKTFTRIDHQVPESNAASSKIRSGAKTSLFDVHNTSVCLFCGLVMSLANL